MAAVRFTSLKQVPFETRQLLRDRLRRLLFLPKNRMAGSDKVPLGDEAMLRLLLGMAVLDEADIARARATYDAERTAGEPEFDALFTAGWLRASWGRISAPMDFSLALRGERGKGLEALQALMSRRHNQSYSFQTIVLSDPKIASIATEIAGNKERPANVPCLTPAWVAARLWDQRSRSDSLSHDLRAWEDRWVMLGYPEIIIFRAWRPQDADEFRAAAWQVLGHDAALTPWSDIRQVFIRRLILQREGWETVDGSAYDNYVIPVPPTLVEKASWLADHRLERNAYELLSESTQGIIRLLWIEMAALDTGPILDPRVVQLLDNVLLYPEFLANLWWRVQEFPQILADMALYGPTSALAVLWVAEWRGRQGAWDQSLIAADTRSARETAFLDVVWVMGEKLRKDEVAASEIAALLDWFHMQSRDTAVESQNAPLFTGLRDVLLDQSRDTLLLLMGEAQSRLRAMPNAAQRLATLLDIVTVGALESDVDAALVTTSYAGTLHNKAGLTPICSISSGAAKSLYSVASREPDSLAKLLDPIDIAAELEEANGEDFRKLSIANDIARAMRAHARVVSRAIVEMKDAVPPDLLAALVDVVHKGALEDEANGRIAIFTPLFETGPVFRSPEAPLATDLASALNALPDSDQDRLLAAFLETNEPAILAQLVPLVSRRLREALQVGLRKLGPEAAAEIWQLTDAQARIDAILGAGVPDIAEKYMLAEAELRPMGKVGGRELTQFRAELRLLFEREDWEGLLKVREPEDFPQMFKSQMQETIQQYKALAVFLKPGGDAAAAAQQFRELYKRNHSAGYASNIFAATIAALLGDQPFRILTAEGIRAGRDALAEIDRMELERRPNDFSSPTDNSYNKALLLLALGEAGTAFSMLSCIPSHQRTARVAAYSAVALKRLDRMAEAKAALEAAKVEFGDSEILDLAAADLRNAPVRASTARLTRPDDGLDDLKLAITDFQNLDAETQAKILSRGDNPLEKMLIADVRAVAAELTGMVPGYSRLAKDGMWEDDASVAFAALLRQRYIKMLRWSVSDQNPGGYSEKGRIGKRDIVIKQDTLTVAVLENVVAKNPINWQKSQDDLAEHFRKLLGYSTCKVFFHLTFAYVQNLNAITVHLRVVSKRPPEGFEYIGEEPIEARDSGPSGFVARYAANGGEIVVCFLILDMGQEIQRDAAANAAVEH